jgi:predicted ferric reductase
MKQLAARPGRTKQFIDLFHTTADVDEAALAKLRADADAAGIRLRVLIDSRDGRLTGERICDAVPEWRQASTWFCGPVGFGEHLKQELRALGVPVQSRFHQELFAMR